MKSIKYIENTAYTLTKQIVRVLTFCTIAISIFTSCDQEEFVDVDTPVQLATGDEVFSNASAAATAVAGMYNQIGSGFPSFLSPESGEGFSVFFALYADEVRVEQDFFGTSIDNYSNFVRVDSDVALGMWTSAYGAIYSANRVIEGITQSPIPDGPEKDQLLGEAYFVRAYLHFHLVKVYGDVPYITATEFEENAEISRTPESEVYANLIGDLNTAISLLQDEYVDENRTRANKAAANALLARAYLFQENWEQAEIQSSLVLENPLYFWDGDIEGVFFTDNPATIWQYDVVQQNSNTEHSLSFNFFNEAVIPLSDQVLEAFEPDDLRFLVHTIPGFDFFGDPIATNLFKYKNESDNSGTFERYKMIRMAEVYLIRAEARAQLNDISGAQEDLDIVRARAGLAPTDASSKEDLVDAVLQERRIELLGESGHRWFDLKRTGRADAVLSAIPEKTNWEAPKSLLLPIPQEDRLLNPNLEQNPGY